MITVYLLIYWVLIFIVFLDVKRHYANEYKKIILSSSPGNKEKINFPGYYYFSFYFFGLIFCLVIAPCMFFFFAFFKGILLGGKSFLGQEQSVLLNLSLGLAFIWSPICLWLISKIILYNFPIFDKFKLLRILYNMKVGFLSGEEKVRLWETIQRTYDSDSLVGYEWKVMFLGFLLINLMVIPITILTMFIK